MFTNIIWIICDPRNDVVSVTARSTWRQHTMRNQPTNQRTDKAFLGVGYLKIGRTKVLWGWDIESIAGVPDQCMVIELIGILGGSITLTNLRLICNILFNFWAATNLVGQDFEVTRWSSIVSSPPLWAQLRILQLQYELGTSWYNLVGVVRSAPQPCHTDCSSTLDFLPDSCY